MSAHALDQKREDSRPGWASLIASELDMVERELAMAVFSDVPAAAGLCGRLISAGGKRVRPALVILSALGVDPGAAVERIANLGAAVELVHSASLVHDDVVDETRERRGVASANAQWGNKISVLGGDFLLARSFSLLANDGDPLVIQILASTAVRMAESEMLQVSAEGDISLWEANYWRIIRDKTANFMGACCAVGAVAAAASPPVRQVLSQYGEQLGMAFQITDDLLDIAGDPALTGKSVGSDLTHGKFTLPVLLALQNLGDQGRQRLRDLLDKGMLSREEACEAAGMVLECGAIDLARQSASSYAQKARELLRVLPEGRYRNALADLTMFVINRQA